MLDEHGIHALPVHQGEDLLWADYELKLVDQAVRTMESYVSQFPDVRVRPQAHGNQRQGSLQN